MTSLVPYRVGQVTGGREDREDSKYVLKSARKSFDQSYNCTLQGDVGEPGLPGPMGPRGVPGPEVINTKSKSNYHDTILAC